MTSRPRGFSDPAEFRAWLAKNHATTAELFVRCAKAHVPRRLTYRQALDEALCTGWIDGVRLELQSEGRVRPAGRKAFEARVKSQYSFESRPRALTPAYRRRFRSNRRAWTFFEAQPPWYRRTSSFWVMSAKQPETRERRLALLVSRSERGEGIPPLKRPAARGAKSRKEA
jgi:uncharacterized protein YdeI (YjbR/CyaY-like superfamily)